MEKAKASADLERFLGMLADKDDDLYAMQASIQGMAPKELAAAVGLFSNSVSVQEGSVRVGMGADEQIVFLKAIAQGRCVIYSGIREVGETAVAGRQCFSGTPEDGARFLNAAASAWEGQPKQGWRPTAEARPRR